MVWPWIQTGQPEITAFEGVKRLVGICGALYSIALIPNAVAATSAIAIAIVIPTVCLTVGMIHLRPADDCFTTSCY